MGVLQPKQRCGQQLSISYCFSGHLRPGHSHICALVFILSPNTCVASLAKHVSFAELNAASVLPHNVMDVPQPASHWYKQILLGAFDPSTQPLADLYDSWLLHKGIEKRIELILCTGICNCRILLGAVKVHPQRGLRFPELLILAKHSRMDAGIMRQHVLRSNNATLIGDRAECSDVSAHALLQYSLCHSKRMRAAHVHHQIALIHCLVKVQSRPRQAATLKQQRAPAASAREQPKRPRWQGQIENGQGACRGSAAGESFLTPHRLPLLAGC